MYNANKTNAELRGMAPKGKPKKSSKSKQQAGYKKDSAKAGASTRHSEKIARDICYISEIFLKS